MRISENTFSLLWGYAIAGKYIKTFRDGSWPTWYNGENAIFNRTENIHLATFKSAVSKGIIAPVLDTDEFYTTYQLTDLGKDIWRQEWPKQYGSEYPGDKEGMPSLVQKQVE